MAGFVFWHCHGHGGDTHICDFVWLCTRLMRFIRKFTNGGNKISNCDALLAPPLHLISRPDKITKPHKFGIRNEKTNVGPIAGLNEYIDLDHME